MISAMNSLFLNLEWLSVLTWLGVGQPVSLPAGTECGALSASCHSLGVT